VYRYELTKLSNGLPLLFDFKIFVITLLILSFALFSSITMYRGLEYSKETQVLIAFISRQYIEKKGIDSIERVLYLVNFVLLNIFRIFMVRHLRLMARFVDKNVSDCEDFSVEIKSIQSAATIDSFQAFFDHKMLKSEALNEDISIQVAAMNFVYRDVSSLIMRNNNIKVLLKGYGELACGQQYDKAELTKQQFEETRDEMFKLLTERYTTPTDESDGKSKKNTCFTGEAYVTFDREAEAMAVLDNLKLNWIQDNIDDMLGYLPEWCEMATASNQIHKYKGQRVYAKKAHHPLEIIWEHRGAVGCTRVSRKLCSFLFMLLIFVASFFSLYGLKIWKTSVQDRFFASLSMTVAIQIFNAIFAYIVRSLIWFEMPETKSELEYKIAFRMTMVASSNEVRLLELHCAAGLRELHDLWQPAQTEDVGSRRPDQRPLVLCNIQFPRPAVLAHGSMASFEVVQATADHQRRVLLAAARSEPGLRRRCVCGVGEDQQVPQDDAPGNDRLVRLPSCHFDIEHHLSFLLLGRQVLPAAHLQNS